MHLKTFSINESECWYSQTKVCVCVCVCLKTIKGLPMIHSISDIKNEVS